MGVGSAGDGLDNTDPVRVGRDHSDPLWIDVGFDRELLDTDPHDDDGFLVADPRWVQKPAVLAQLRLLREALVLTSIVAKTDYGCWFRMMEEHTDFVVSHSDVPVDGALPEIPVQFHFKLGSQQNALFLDSTNVLGHVLGDRQYGDEFQRDHARTK